jgi:hypothetical protein
LVKIPKLAALRSLESFTILEEHAVYRPAGEYTLDAAVELITTSIVLTRKQKVRKLLVIVTELTGFPSPSIIDRYFFMHQWADAARGAVCLAMVAHAEMIDREKFGVTVANNRGLRCDVFAVEAEAIAWLQSIK